MFLPSGRVSSHASHVALDGRNCLKKEAGKTKSGVLEMISLEKNAKIEKWVFFPALFLSVAMIACIYLFPSRSEIVINEAFNFCTVKIGWVYILSCFLSFGFLIWLSCSRYAGNKFGGEDSQPTYSYFSWTAMLFTAGVGLSVVILGFLEPIYYVSNPPFELEAFSSEAYEYAHMYGQFHWGLSAWAFYNPAIVAVAYSLFVKKQNKLSLGNACMSIFEGNGKIKRIMGYFVDILVVFGVIASISTSLGLGTPVIGLAIRRLLGLSDDYTFVVCVGILLVWIMIFGTSVFLGLDKGIKNLSLINLILAGGFMLLILFVGPTNEILKMEVNSVGLYMQNFIRLSTWMAPFGDSSFVENWTIFYWGWWIAFMPMMGMFVARISQGRTVREVVWGQMLWGSAGCALSFMVFGGYTLFLQKNGIVDISGILRSGGQGKAILAILDTLPFPEVTTVFFCVLCFIYLATTIDSCAYVLAGTTTTEMRHGEEPARWNRLIWAAIFCASSIGLLFIDGFKAVQTISIVAGLPLIGVLVILMLVSAKMLKHLA